VRNRLPCILTLAAALVLGAIATGASSPTIGPFGLDGRVVTSLGYYNSLYAGTVGAGVFRRNPSDPQSDWISLGLQAKHVRAVYPHSSGPLGFATTVGLVGDPLNPDSTLIYCLDLDQPPWIVADAGMSHDDVTTVCSLDGFPTPVICGETFAATIGESGGVWRRAFNETQWEFVLDVGFGVGNVVRADPSSRNVWAGGENALMAPWIARSTDQGDTWQVAYPDLAGDNACNAIALHPDDPDVAYAGMEGSVVVTSDGGVTWQPTGLTGTQAYIYGVALDSASPWHILAGGMVQNPNNWALWESFNGGHTWTEIPPPPLQPPGNVTGISAIVADPGRAGVFYLATRGHGVWEFTGPSTGVGDAPASPLVFEQNYPNPFNPHTTLVFEIPSSLDGSHARLALYTVRGELVRVLLDQGLNAGRHEHVWNGEDDRGRDLPSGIYYARLRAGSQQASLKLNLLR
jgi:hypothetical protein